MTRNTNMTRNKSFHLVRATLLTLCAWTTAATHANEAPITLPRTDIALAGAEKVLDAAFEEAKRNSWLVSVAVVDAAGELVALRKADGAIGISPSVAIGKARTAALLRQPLKNFEEYINNGRPSFLAAPDVLPLEGGMPIVVDGITVGAVGVSGAHGPNDSQVATIAAKSVTQ